MFLVTKTQQLTYFRYLRSHTLLVANIFKSSEQASETRFDTIGKILPKKSGIYRHRYLTAAFGSLLHSATSPC